jgi:Na+-transporting NADH:ubiquinone oxidoreductase subunit NqrD
LQHCAYQVKCLSLIRKNLPNSHKLISYLNLIEAIPIESDKIKAFLANDRIFSSFSKFPTYEECVALVPRNGIYVVLQMNVNLS